MIPEAKKDAVACALWEVFGVTEFEGIRTLTAGLTSALVFRIVVRGCSYLLRVIMSTNAAAGPGQGDPTHQFACMREAAEAGIAPRVLYTSTEDWISITDFVEARPFSRIDALARLPVTLRRLHALPPLSGAESSALLRRYGWIRSKVPGCKDSARQRNRGTLPTLCTSGERLSA